MTAEKELVDLSGRPPWRRRPRKKAQRWCTHNTQGTASIIARLLQVSPGLPPRPQALRVCPGCQPGGGGAVRAARYLFCPCAPTAHPCWFHTASPKQLT